jgi:hypothetical protein
MPGIEIPIKVREKLIPSAFDLPRTLELRSCVIDYLINSGLKHLSHVLQLKSLFIRRTMDFLRFKRKSS